MQALGISPASKPFLRFAKNLAQCHPSLILGGICFLLNLSTPLSQSSSLFFCVSADLCVNPSPRESPRLCVILFFRMNLEEAMIELWRQVLLEDAKSVTVSSECFPVRTTPKSRLRRSILFLTESRSTARSGKKVMQFLSNGQYIANVVDGQLELYGKK
jgi:hypothetical protein